MYSAYCPNCGGVLTSQTPGPVRIGCPCGWAGNLTMAPVPATIGGLGGGLGMFFTPPVPVVPAPTTQPSPAASSANVLDARRDHARTLLDRLTAEAQGSMRTLTADEWALEPWRQYERLQQAHGRLFETLGGVRMGAYRPDSAKARAAVIEVLLWTLLVFDGTTR